ncbi:hypothetical protein [Peribacillus faecalis]|nr:hypothetical protein [Peribacillus faecalis]
MNKGKMLSEKSDNVLPFCIQADGYFCGSLLTFLFGLVIAFSIS